MIVDYKIFAESDEKEEFIDRLAAALKDDLEDFMWTSREPFRLWKAIKQPFDNFCVYEGSTNCGDSVNDEWFIVWLLVKITRLFTNTIATVQDEDGQFLLIECAYSLPQWMQPDIMENRVFLRQGKLVIVGQSDECMDLKVTLCSAKDARWIAGNDIQRDLEKRLEAVEKSDSLHFCRAILPRDLARAISKYPHLVPLAAQAFCERACERSLPTESTCRFSPKTSVVAPIRIPKYSFAMLKSSGKWEIPRSFIFGDLDKVYRRRHRLPREFDWLDTGTRLWMGFELLYASSRLSHSCEHGEIWLSNFNGVQLTPDKSPAHYVTEGIHFSREDYATEEQFDDFQMTMTSKWKNIDDDSWMYVTPEEMDKLLSERSGGVPVNTIKTPEDLESMFGKVDDFLSKKMGGFEGVDDDEEWSDEDSEEGESDEELVQMMEAMDHELKGDKVSEPDVTLLKNLLKSFAGQAGDTGPVQTMLNSIGINLPPNDDFGGTFDSDSDYSDDQEQR